MAMAIHMASGHMAMGSTWPMGVLKRQPLEPAPLAWRFPGGQLRVYMELHSLGYTAENEPRVVLVEGVLEHNVQMRLASRPLKTKMRAQIRSKGWGGPCL